MFVEVLLDQNLSKRLDYAVPLELQPQVEIGMRVEVPLRKAVVKGTIASVKMTTTMPGVRPIAKLLSNQGELTEAQWKLAHWMARYYAAPLQKVLKCFLPPHIRHDVQSKEKIHLSLAISHAEALCFCQKAQAKSPAQASIIEIILKEPGGILLSKLVKEHSISQSAIRELVKKKILKVKKILAEEDLLLEAEFFLASPKILNTEQQECVSSISNALSLDQFSSHLIYGVTGSGKTEVYLRAIADALKLGKGTILLVPEVSLTSQTIERFRARFSEKIAILHHKRSLGEKSLAWEKLRKGEVKIAIGARSAIFAPMPNLGLIIVDEEHDGSYKQNEEMPCYHARNVAVMRAYLEKAVVILGSATPSIESRHNADIGKYRLHTLKNRAAKASLPNVRIIDMKLAFERQKGFTHFSQELLDGIEQRLKLGEQILLFLNRRGYHRLQICKECRMIIKCPHCDLGLTFHKEHHFLKCHLCSYQRPSPRQCPSCNAINTLEFKGFGTEHVERSLHAIFPQIRTLRMDRDTTGKKNSHEDLFKQFRSHKADVLIGTQMVAKGFHFPSVTLVGVLNLDASLSIPDFRSGESVFQLFTQVAGRAGRSELPGEVILQTFLPEHPMIRLAVSQDFNAFYETEIKERKLFGYPPFVHLIKCLFSDPKLEIAKQAAEGAYQHLLPRLPSYAQILPCVPSGHPKIKDLYRFQFLIKTDKIEPILPLLSDLPPNPASMKIDVDPLSTFF